MIRHVLIVNDPAGLGDTPLESREERGEKLKASIEAGNDDRLKAKSKDVHVLLVHSFAEARTALTNYDIFAIIVLGIGALPQAKEVARENAYPVNVYVVSAFYPEREVLIVNDSWLNEKTLLAMF